LQNNTEIMKQSITCSLNNRWASQPQRQREQTAELDCMGRKNRSRPKKKTMKHTFFVEAEEDHTIRK
jgi:hypothetical protein